MLHKIKQPRVQQHQSRLPNVKEEPQGVNDFISADPASIAQPSHIHGNAAKENPAPAPKIATMEPNLQVESSPLPLRRALLTSIAGKKCGPTTPVPGWKMFDNPFVDAISTSNEHANLDSKASPAMVSGRCRHSQMNVSARKLAAMLWELHGVRDMAGDVSKGKGRHQKGITDMANHLRMRGGMSNCNAHSADMARHHHNAKEETSRQLEGLACQRQKDKDPNGAATYHQVNQDRPLHSMSGARSQSKEHRHHSPRFPAPGTSLHSPHQTSPVTNKAEATGSTSHTMNIFPSDVNAAHLGTENESTLSCELVKVLSQIWSLEEQYNASTSTVASLRADLKKTKAHVQDLRAEQNSYQADMELLNKKLADEKALLQDRAQEAVLIAIKPLKEELENEKKSKQKLESKHEKLCQQMNDARKALVKALQDFEREQKARELMEDVCDELAREIGEDKAQVEELKRQSAKFREEVEQERRMLQMAEVWREERVQMKLAEARLELEEKNSVLDKLRGELEAFLRAKRYFDDCKDVMTGNVEDHATSTMDFQSSSMGASAPTDITQEEKGAVLEAGEVDDDVLFDDDLHSIELHKVSVSDSLGDHPVEFGNESHEEVANGKQSLLKKVTLSHGKQSHDQGAVLSNASSNGNQAHVMSKPGLERTRSNLVEALKAEAQSSEIQEVDEHGIREWDLGKRSEGPLRSWQRDYNEVFKETAAIGMKVQGKCILGQSDSLSKSAVDVSFLDLHGDRVVSNLHVFGDKNADADLPPSKQAATFTSSPAHQRGPYASYSQRGSQVSEDMARASRDTSLKARLLEAKLEGQHAKSRNSKLF